MRDFNHTVSVLVKAYMNDTLLHMDCAACAVGNIIADSLHCKIVSANKDLGYAVRDHKVWQRGNVTLEPIWQRVFFTPKPQGKQRKWPKKFKGYMQKQIEATGYTWVELAHIERAFESVPVVYNDGIQIACCINHDQWMLNGLMAVVDVLAEIHSINLTTREETKKLFVKV